MESKGHVSLQQVRRNKIQICYYTSGYFPSTRKKWR